MMDHTQFIATLPNDRLTALKTRSDAHGLRHLAGHLGLITLCAFWIAGGWWLWPLILPVQGIAVCFLFTLVHETTHKTPFRTHALNEWVGRLAGFAVLLPLEWFRYFHLAHHRHTNIPGRDPELHGGAAPATWRTWLLHVSGLPYWAGMARQIAINAAGGDPGDFIPLRARARVRREARVMLAGYALAALSLMITPLPFWIWLLPCLLGQPFLRLYLMAEHGRCAFSANIFENTRTTLTNRIIRFLAWNMPYHTEHHTLPQVPFHKLPALHAEMQGHHHVLSEGYLRVTRESTATLR